MIFCINQEIAIARLLGLCYDFVTVVKPRKEEMMNTMIDRFFRSGQLKGFLLLFLVIFSVSMLTSFFPLWANVPLHVFLPIVILLTRPMVMFEKLKLSTLVIMRTMIVLVLFHGMSGDTYITISSCWNS